MNEYIINPMWVYLINVVNNARTIAVLALVITGVLFFVTGMAYLTAKADLALAIKSQARDRDNEIEYHTEIKNLISKILRGVTIVMGISTLIVVFVPNQETLITMWLAKLTTYDNAELAIQAIQNATDYIVNALKN